MDPRNGEILASASLPDFDPNDFRAADEQARMNRPAIWAYEPGSVFKIFSIASLLESQAIAPSSTFICDGHYEQVTSRGERITINCLSAHGRVSAREIIIYSCNAGAAYASDRIAGDAFYELVKNLGFGSRTASGTPGETAGFFRPADTWSQRSKPTIAMGQEIAVSALQMLQAASAIANDGLMSTPHYVARIVSEDGATERPFELPPQRRVLRAETARELRSYMVDVTSNIGTGWRANVDDLSMAVKTGTAQLIDPATGAYSDTDFIASCIALLPAEAPSLVVYLAIIKPQGASYLGGRIAAPIVREAAEAIVNYSGIPRGRNQVVSHSGAIRLGGRDDPEVFDTVPDFSGFTKRQILPLLLRDDLSFEISGDGHVALQSPPPGTPLTPTTRIILQFE
jgi:cell division protein FtsI (penicillin-binding protein 3)